eukprot:363116-Chlamydomonas_euryale.AAC.14
MEPAERPAEDKAERTCIRQGTKTVGESYLTAMGRGGGGVAREPRQMPQEEGRQRRRPGASADDLAQASEDKQMVPSETPVEARAKRAGKRAGIARHARECAWREGIKKARGMLGAGGGGGEGLRSNMSSRLSKVLVRSGARQQQTAAQASSMVAGVSVLSPRRVNGSAFTRVYPALRSRQGPETHVCVLPAAHRKVAGYTSSSKHPLFAHGHGCGCCP